MYICTLKKIIIKNGKQSKQFKIKGNNPYSIVTFIR